MEKYYKEYLMMTKSQEYIDLHNYYGQETFLDVLGVARQENPHSSFIRWLLDPKSEHAFSWRIIQSAILHVFGEQMI